MTTLKIGRFSQRLTAATVALMLLASCGSSTKPLEFDNAYTKAEPGDELVVHAIIHRDDTGTYLCAASLESYPPQCSIPKVELTDLDADALGLTEYPRMLADGTIDSDDTSPVLQGEITAKVAVESKETWRYLELVEGEQ